MVIERKLQLAAIRHGGAVPVIHPAPRLADVAVAAKHLQVRRAQGELGKQRSRFDVVNVQRYAVSPRGLSAQPTLRPAVVRMRDGIQPQRFVAQFAPFAGRVEISRVKYAG